MKEICEAITNFGTRCVNKRVIDKYCLVHYYVVNKIKRNKKIKIDKHLFGSIKNEE